MRKRAAIADKFVDTAKVFKKLNNFNGIMQSVSAMEGAAVHRLSKTFDVSNGLLLCLYVCNHPLLLSDLFMARAEGETQE